MSSSCLGRYSCEPGGESRRERWPRTTGLIAEALRLEQSTVNRRVDAAIADGLLRRHREPGRSAALVAPTEHA